MKLHHDKHHRTYVTMYNATEEKLHDAMTRDDVIAQIRLQNDLKFNGGGHVNHRYYSHIQ